MNIRKLDKIWYIDATSESGDKAGPFFFNHPPTEDEQIEVIESMGENINEDGPGDFGSYVYLTIGSRDVKNEYLIP